MPSRHCSEVPLVTLLAGSPKQLACISVGDRTQGGAGLAGMLVLLLHASGGVALPRRQPCRAVQLQQGQHCVKHVKLFWDLDNINARSAEHALVIGHRLKRTVERLTGLPPAASVFANEATINRLRQRSSEGSWDAVLDVLDLDLVVAGLEKDAADLLMRRDMVYFAEEHGPSAAVVCVSNDQGYAPALERCSKLGAFTVAVGTYLRTAGFNWSQPPSKLPVPSAANCIVAWHPGRSKQQSAAELQLVADWQQRIGADTEAADASRLTKHKGVILTRWINRDRPLQPSHAIALPRRARSAAGNTSGGSL